MQQPPPNYGQGYGPPSQGQGPPPGYGPPQGYGPPPQGYGPPPKKPMGFMAKVGLVALCMFGGCVVIAGIGAANKSGQATATTATPGTPTAASPESKPTPTPAAAPKPTAVNVSAAQLFAAYEANEVSADERYKGKALLVTGKIASIDKDFTDSIVLRLATSNQFQTIDANLEDSEKPKAGRLSKGEAVRVQCKGSGMVIGSPQLGDCVIQ